MFTEFHFTLGFLMMIWESYLGYSVIKFIMNTKYMTLTSTTKRSLYFYILVMVLFYQTIFTFVYYCCLFSIVIVYLILKEAQCNHVSFEMHEHEDR